MGYLFSSDSIRRYWRAREKQKVSTVGAVVQREWGGKPVNEIECFVNSDKDTQF